MAADSHVQRERAAVTETERIWTRLTIGAYEEAFTL